MNSFVRVYGTVQKPGKGNIQTVQVSFKRNLEMVFRKSNNLFLNQYARFSTIHNHSFLMFLVVSDKCVVPFPGLKLKCCYDLKVDGSRKKTSARMAIHGYIKLRREE